MTATRTILIVDDEPGLANTLAIIFQRAGYDASAVYSAAQAVPAITANPPSLVLTDVIMPGMNGIDLAKKVCGTWPDCKVLLLSGNADTQELLEAAQREGYSFEILAKPVHPLQLLAKVASVLVPVQ